MKARLIALVLLSTGVEAKPRPGVATPAAEETAPAQPPFPEAVQRALDGLVRAELGPGAVRGCGGRVARGHAVGGRPTGSGTWRGSCRPRRGPRGAWRPSPSPSRRWRCCSWWSEGRLELDADIRTVVPTWPEKRGR